MTSETLRRILTVLTLIAVSTHSAEARSRNRVQKAQVRFLATSTILRGTWGSNEDTYLAELHLSAKSEPVIVRLIDEYPNAFPPLSAAVLTSRSETVLRVQRDSQCDLPYGAMLLRTAPGDPMAIVHERIGYQPKMDKRPEPSAVLPCYHTVRR